MLSVASGTAMFDTVNSSVNAFATVVIPEILGTAAIIVLIFWGFRKLMKYIGASRV